MSANSRTLWKIQEYMEKMKILQIHEPNVLGSFLRRKYDHSLLGGELSSWYFQWPGAFALISIRAAGKNNIKEQFI